MVGILGGKVNCFCKIRIDPPAKSRQISTVTTPSLEKWLKSYAAALSFKAFHRDGGSRF
jgi:hypothetical protein